MKKIIFILIITLSTFISSLVAQPVPTPRPAVNGNCPIDGGAFILLSLVVLYGIRKLFKAGKKQ